MGLHERFIDDAAIYVIGGLAPAERRVFEAHLAACALCAAEVRAFQAVADAVGGASVPAEPATATRQRFVDVVARTSSPARATVPPQSTRSAWHWLAVAAAVVLAVASGLYAARVRGGLAEAERSMAVMSATDLVRVDLEGQPAAPAASARAFVSRSRGLIFTAARLPPLPAGRIYQLWIVSAQAPVSIGLLRPDSSGSVQFVSDGDALPRPVAVAVTIEPEGGVPAPTGAKYLVGLASGL